VLSLTPALRAMAPTFAADIAPILYQQCAPCHHSGESAPFPLVAYADVKKHAAQIATVTRSGFMPPSLPEHGYGDFAGEHLRPPALRVRRRSPNRRWCGSLRG
jgi:hypothetical protein